MVAGFLVGMLVATLTTPVGVSGAVLLLPVQVGVFGVPSPAVSPTNLLYNVVSVPGALLRYRMTGGGRSPLAVLLLPGAVFGVVLGALLRVLVLPDGTLFRVLVAGLLFVLGIWLLIQDRRGAVPEHPRLSERTVRLLGLAAGVIGGIYGVGGGSLLAPILVVSGFAVASVAPAALLTTLVTSCAGALTFAVLAATGHPETTPQWGLGLACGLGGLIGGYIGASLQPRVPHRALRLLLGVLAVLLAFAMLLTATRTG